MPDHRVRDVIDGSGAVHSADDDVADGCLLPSTCCEAFFSEPAVADTLLGCSTVAGWSHGDEFCELRTPHQAVTCTRQRAIVMCRSSNVKRVRVVA